MMSSEKLLSRRRPRSDIESNDDDDVERSSQGTSPSSSGKRARTNRYRNSQSPASESSRGTQGSRNRANRYDRDDEADLYSSAEGDEQSEFQPGAIVRVKLTNFVTYENAEFFPGPNLNMVIGPNGTGKSSLVCAICLGLGWGPQHLGRAGQVGEFVKHNMPDGCVEIELQRRPSETSNHVVKLRIIRDGNAREFWLNGRKTSLKAVQELTKGLSIQIDNLCQFLPQDKVSEFAALSPVDLLLQTQRAAAPEQMLEWHEALKIRRREQKVLETQNNSDKEELQGHENRQQNLQAEVQRLRERQQVQEKVMFLKKKIPFVEYRHARTEHINYKEKKMRAHKRLNTLLERVEPTLASVTSKQSLTDKLSAHVTEQMLALKAVEREASDLMHTLDVVDEEIRAKDAAVAAERNLDSARKRDVEKLQRSIRDDQARLNDPPIEFNSVSWNQRTREMEHEVRDIENEFRDLKAQNNDITSRGNIVASEKDATENELSDFDSQEGQQMNKVEKLSPHTAQAWKWVQDHRDQFEKEVYGPPIISCSIKDSRYTNAMESLFQKADLLSITAQTKGDWQKLSDQFLGTMKLHDVTVRSVTDPLSAWPRPRLSAEEMVDFGLDSFAIDLIDAPEPVLSMLCDKVKLHLCAIGLQENSEEQHAMITQRGVINRWIVGNHSYQVNRRAEYGPMATSTTARTVSLARYWTDAPIDVSRRKEIESKISELSAQFQILKSEVTPIREKMAELRKSRENIVTEINKRNGDKAELQKAYNARQALPDKIERQLETLRTKQSAAETHKQRIWEVNVEHDEIVLRKVRLALDHKEIISRIRSCHEVLLEGEIRLIEAKSDIEALQGRNSEINQRVEREREAVDYADAESRKAKDRAQRALNVCKEIQADPANESICEELAQSVQGLTVEALQTDIEAEEAKLEFIHANNPNAIRDYEKRQADVERLQAKIAETEKRLNKLERFVTKVRSEWEPELDKLIAEISEAFSYNFEQIGCAGEIGIHKDDDFEQWAIQIKVKFRENETLQLLDQHRQSGGERSVSTIFYLMSLQSLARAPFRVVDEINQGMDPRNERMVHERMVEIACKEHTSQYFLITPKLLTGLRYDRRMKVLCIASGEHMPEDYKKLDIGRIIGIQKAIMAAG